jgi:exonuclease VII small subunit
VFKGETVQADSRNKTQILPFPGLIDRLIERQISTQTEIERVRTELERAGAELEQAGAELEQAGAELEQAGAELEQARAELEQARADLTQLRSESAELKHKARSLSEELDSFRHRRVIRLLRRLRDRSDLANDVSPEFQQLKDDSLIFTPTLKGYRLQPSVNLQRVPFRAYPLELNRPNLRAVLLVPHFDLFPEHGSFGIEVVSPAGQVVAQVTVPFSQVSLSHPTCFNFDPILGSDQGRHWLRVFVRDADSPVRLFEWRKYRLLGLGPLQTRAFCGFMFDEST